MSSVLVQGGRVIDPSQNIDSSKDILIRNGKIAAIDDPGKIPAGKAEKTVDARGCWVTPGLIDMHVHFREPGLEYKETILTGSRAAIAGGFTSVACMANTHPVNDNPYVTAFIREKARAADLCRIFPIGAVTKGLKGEELAEIGGMLSEGAVALSDDGMPIMNSYLMRKAMDYVRSFGVPIISHAEDWNLVGQGVMNEGALSNELGLRGNPAAAEEIMVAREIALCRLTKAPVHIAHLSTEVAIEHVRRAKEAGLPVTAEASPHHLILTEAAVRSYDTNFKMAPPLRTERDVEALRQALREGVVDVMASDHAPHGAVDKVVEFDQAANGIIGLQSNVPITLKLFHEGILTPSQWVNAFSCGPAKLLRLDLGSLKVGKDADITVVHADEEWKFERDDIESKSQNSPFIGWNMKGRVRATIVGGRVLYEGGKILG